MADTAPSDDATSSTTTTSAPAGPDPEVTAISKVNDALMPLEPAVRQRVLHWAALRFEVTLPKGKPAVGKGDDDDTDDQQESEGAPNSGAAERTFSDFASLYDAANPRTDAERALIAGYWLQVSQNKQDFDAFNANKELRNLGHPLTNVTASLSELIYHKPRYVIQTRKEGTSKQARKKYKVTNEGIKRVKQMLGGVVESGSSGQS